MNASWAKKTRFDEALRTKPTVGGSVQRNHLCRLSDSFGSKFAADTPIEINGFTLFGIIAPFGLWPIPSLRKPDGQGDDTGPAHRTAILDETVLADLTLFGLGVYAPAVWEE